MSDELHYHRIKNLISGLISRTEDDDDVNRLKWEAVGVGAYEISLKRSSLRIASEDEEGDWFPYKFTMMDENGNEIEEVHALASRPDEFRLQDLFKAASRSHRGISEKLTEVFQELGIPDPPPPPPKSDPWGSAPSRTFGGDDEPPF
ncbi:hypothetical protein ACRU43_20585 [Mycobacterium colombiense]|uniref:Uncharacterized protein n=1 Tax=Mycobacterium [tuberculosis] TKK-01-0051 TaxID=1324261 RepID=A0A051TS09_9MYCO|nr:hypothetical protein [Mycobacterium colombiense]KBZ59595.1 hypothetical protein K875_05160 [Mycobacterium [tuberculosis] TKK-01-0051]